MQIEINRRGTTSLYLLQALAFLIYSGLLLFSISRHELWGDEIHSWNIAKASASLLDLIQNIRYEGHPPVWYVILFYISRISHNPEWFQWAHAIISISILVLILYVSPFPMAMKLMIPLGYYFAFEYSVLSRNYAVGILISFIVCLVLTRHFKYRLPVFYFLIFLLSNTHLLGLVLAMAFCVYLAYEDVETSKNFSHAATKILLGIIVILPAMYFIIPPTDSEMNFSFWVDRWSFHQFSIILQIPIKSFFTIPAWWDYHFWNTNFLLDSGSGASLIKVGSIFISFGILGTASYILRNNKRSLVLFSFNFLLTCAVAFVFPLTSTRYVGFVFIAFIVSIWLYLNSNPLPKRQEAIVLAFLILQMIGSMIALSKDWVLPFSNSAKVKDLYERIPENELVVTDYWCLNNLATFVDKPIYCLELKRDATFLLWDQELAKGSRGANHYTARVQELITQKPAQRVYLISTNDIKTLQVIDPLLMNTFSVSAIFTYEGAIESHSNVYLYLIKAKN